MKGILANLVVVFVCLMQIFSQASAQDFYDKNYAESPLNNKAQRPPHLAKPESDVSTEASSEAKSGNPETWQTEMGQNPTPTPAPLDLAALAQPYDVVSIGAILNSLDAKHFDEKMAELVEVVQRHDLNVSNVYTIGNMQSPFDSQLAAGLVARGGIIKIAGSVPPEYPISLSPTWIIKTAQGEFLLEATGPLQKHFNQRGQYLDVQRMP